MTFYTVYKVTNKINGKTYIGSHKTRNLDDGYMGSGKYLNRAYGKHGIENFQKDILHVFETPEEMYAKEAELVNEEYLTNENTYNLKVGGFGGFDFVNNNPEKFLTPKRMKSLWTNKERHERWKRKYETDPTFRKKVAENGKRGLAIARENNPNGTFFGKTHSEDTIKKMRQSAKGKHKGKKNSQYGSMWITNGASSKKISKLSSIPRGWRKGRVIARVA